MAEPMHGFSTSIPLALYQRAKAMGVNLAQAARAGLEAACEKAERDAERKARKAK